MRLISWLLGAFALGSLVFPAYGQELPPGSYQQSCRNFRIQGATLTALCRRAQGRGEQLTALNIAHCVGDIGNHNGQLTCNGGGPAAPAPSPLQAQAYPPGYAPPPPAYQAPGYGPPPRYGEDRPYGERCERLRHQEHELRDRLAHTPYGGEREQLQYRLGRIQAEREHCRHR